MTQKTLSGDAVKADLSQLHDAMHRAPGVYEVLRLYEQYEKVLAQARGYLVGPAPTVVGFSSSDRTG